MFCKGAAAFTPLNSDCDVDMRLAIFTEESDVESKARIKTD
jgi:hypothetical protein